MKKTATLIVLAFFSVYIIWGSTYLWNKIAVAEIPPMLLAAIRFSSAGILLMLLARIMKKSLSISKRQFVNSSIAGFLFLVYGNGVAVWALKYIDSGFAALLASTEPILVLLLMYLMDGKKIQVRSIIGVCLGVLGMYLLVGQKEITTSKDIILGTLMMLSCVLSWSYGSVFVSKHNLPKSFLVSTGYQMLVAGGLLFVTSLVLNETWSLPSSWSAKTQITMILLIVFGGAVAFTSYNYLLKKVSPDKATTFAYVNPVIALILGWYFLDEKISFQSAIASAVLLLGVYFINSRERQSKIKTRVKSQKI
ncbi:MAG: EamA family transporter [Tenacibaculum sp.]